MHKMLWLPTLQKMRTSDSPLELPSNDNLFMCFGRRIGSGDDASSFGCDDTSDVLQVLNVFVLYFNVFFCKIFIVGGEVGVQLA